jgi:hypothetical protein
VLIGVAQEKASIWRSWKAKGHEHRAHLHMEWGRQMGFVNHYYFYLWDPEWGPTFWKTNADAPWPVWLCLNGYEWAEQQLAKRGIAHSHRYDLTNTGRRVAVLFTKTYGRVLTPGLSRMDPALPERIAARSPLGTAWRQLERTINQFIDSGLKAA